MLFSKMATEYLQNLSGPILKKEEGGGEIETEEKKEAVAEEGDNVQ